MSVNTKRFLRNLWKKKWEIIQYMLVVVVVVMIWHICYNQYLIRYELKNTITSKNNEIAKKETDMELEKKSPTYIKYMASKTLYEKTKNINWTLTINNLISIITDIKNLWQTEKWLELEIDNFDVNVDEIKLAWKVWYLKALYKDGWIIDKFIWLPFVDHLNIPNYQKEWMFIRFDLNAKIKTNEWKPD